MLEVRTQASQRLDDLELMEKALCTVQKQQLQLRTVVDETVHSVTKDASQLGNRTDSTEAKLNSYTGQMEQTRKKILHLERDQRQRFDNIAKVFAVRINCVAFIL